MQNSYNYHFKYFDPKNGTLPEPYAVIFAELNYRARKILEPFTSDEINLSIQSINKFTRDKAFVNYLWEDLKNEPIKIPILGKICDVIPSTSNIEAIFKNMENIHLKNFVDNPNFDWPHLFASIALFHSELISNFLHTQAMWKVGDIFPRPTNERLNNFVSEFITDTKQAITFAELLIREKQIQSIQASKAAKQRFAKTSDPLRDLVIQAYIDKKYQDRTNRDAASKIFKELQDSRIIVFDSIKNQTLFNNNIALTTDDPTHRFEKWIGEYKKNLS